MPTVTDVQPRMMGSTSYIVRETHGHQCLAPESQPDNLKFTYLVKFDPSSEQEFYVNLQTKTKLWELPDVDGDEIERLPKGITEVGESNVNQETSPSESVEFGGTIYALCDGQYVPQDLPIVPVALHCWRPIFDAVKGRYMYENCETGERAVHLPPLAQYCDAVRQLYSYYGVDGYFIDALRTRSGDERRLAEELAIQYGSALPLGGCRAAREVAESYFRRHDLSKVDEIDTLIQKWRGNEIGFVDTLRKEYGDRPRTTRERVRAIYAQYCPEKLLNCDEQVDQYADQSEEILDALQKKFGPETISEFDSPVLIRERIHSQLLKYDSAKKFTVDDVLERHRGNEVQLLELLVRYYGPEASEAERKELLLKSTSHSNNWANGGDKVEAPSEVEETSKLDNSSLNNGLGHQEAQIKEEEDVHETVEGIAIEPERGPEWDGLVEQTERSSPTEEGQEAEGNHLTNGSVVEEQAHPEEQLTRGEECNENQGAQSPGALQSGPVGSSASPFTNGLSNNLPTRASLLAEERRVRELEFQRQQQNLVQAEERLARQFEGHRRLIALESEKRWQEDAERVLEIARAAAVQAAREVTRQQSREIREREEDKNSQRLRSETAAANRAAQLEAQLSEAVAVNERSAQRGEQLRAENARLVARIAEIRQECDLELRGMRIHLDDVRVRAAALRGEHEVRALRQREHEAAALTGLRREFDLARADAAAECAAMRVDKEEREAALRGELESVQRERDAARAAAADASARVAELEELNAATERIRQWRREQSAQTEDPEELPDKLTELLAERDTAQQELAELLAERDTAQQEFAELLAERDTAQQEFAELLAERDTAQQEFAELLAERDAAQRRVTELLAEREVAKRRTAGLVAERDAARAEANARSRQAAQRFDLRRLAAPDEGEAAEGAGTPEDFSRSQRSLAEAHAESAILKREIRDLRSLLAGYMSNARRPVGW